MRAACVPLLKPEVNAKRCPQNNDFNRSREMHLMSLVETCLKRMSQ